MCHLRREKKFELGRVLVTIAVIKELHPADILDALDRHQSGDWGEITLGQMDLNEDSCDPCEVVSIYRYHRTRFAITTSADRKETVVRLEEEREEEEEE